MGILYIVATPIGNLKDLTARAIEILTKVEIIACEDTRHTGLLLKYIRENYTQRRTIGDSGQDGHQTVTRQARMTNQPTLLSYYEQNELQRIPQILNVLKNGVNVALVSDAGTPSISDPGFKLVRQCIKEGIVVVSIPGPTSAISGLVASGLPTDKFLFLGYLPKKTGKRKKLLNELLRSFETSKQIHPTVIFFESPYRLIDTLQSLLEVFGDINIVVARELTKKYEEIRREKISESIDHFSKIAPKGEFVILFHIDIK